MQVKYTYNVMNHFTLNYTQRERNRFPFNRENEMVGSYIHRDFVKNGSEQSQQYQKNITMEIFKKHSY